MKKTGLIYMITSKTSGKSYIGKSMEYRFDFRLEQHEIDDSNTHFARAKRKYGWNDFKIEVIEKDILKSEMSKREIYWINYYDTFINGYNSTIGGEGGNTYAKKSENEMKEIKARISKSNSGSNNGNKGQYVGEFNGMYGKKHPAGHRYNVCNLKNGQEYKNLSSVETAKIIGYTHVNNKANAIRRVIERYDGRYNDFIVIKSNDKL